MEMTISAGPGAIQDAIDYLQANSPDPGDTLILNPGTTYNENSIVIKKDITIRANTVRGGSAANTIIDGLSAGRIFDNRGGYNLTLDRLTLRNGLAPADDASGSAILQDGGTLTITRAAFANCSATADSREGFGGAIYADDSSTIIDATTFTGCSASGGGGAIHSSGTLTITGSGFTSCTTTREGGAIRTTRGDITITATEFSGCTAQNGGAIHTTDSTLTIGSSSFSGCATYDGYGSAINVENCSLTIGSTTFSGCTSENGAGGGAIQAARSTVNITSATFSSCSTDGRGGAINVADSSLTIGASSFSGCTAMRGGAIAADDNSTVVINPGTRFTGCMASRTGGALYSSSNVAISFATFSECTSSDAGGAIHYRDNGETPAPSLTITSSTFTNTNGVSRYGGAIYTEGRDVSITNSTFSGYRAEDEGGAIFNEFGDIAIASSAFTDCASGSGGAIYSEGGNLDISSATTFSGCSATGNGGAIAGSGIGNIAIDSSVFSDCWSTSPDGSAGAGGAIWAEGLATTLTVSTTSITGCRAASGGAIASEYDVTLQYCRIYDNGANAVTSFTGDADYNWWGRNSGPADGEVDGPDAGHWLVLGITANPDTLTAGETAHVPANLTYNERGGYEDPSGGHHVPDNIPVLFTLTRGTGTLQPAAGGTESGVNATAFMSASGTMAMVNATVDGETVGVPINVNGAAFTGTPLSGTSPLRVTFTESSVGSPAMWNWSFGDGSWFNTTNATEASPSHTYTSTGTYTVSLSVTGAFGTHTLTRTRYVIVNPAQTSGSSQDSGGSGDTSDFPSSAVSPVTTGAGTFPLRTVAVNIGGDSKAWQAIVTGTKLSELIVTGTVQNGPGTNQTAPPGIVYQYISLVPARYDTITGAVINFTVSQSWLDENHIDPESIVLYHYTANGWEALPTTVLYTKDGTVYFSAASPGFSLFSIAGTPAVATPVVTRTPPPVMNEAVQTPTPAAITKTPVTTLATALPADKAQAAAPSPLLDVILVIAAFGTLGAGGFLVRRWWIRRQNPALFEEND